MRDAPSSGDLQERVEVDVFLAMGGEPVERFLDRSALFTLTYELALERVGEPQVGAVGVRERLFAALLRSLGFRVSLLAGRVGVDGICSDAPELLVRPVI